MAKQFFQCDVAESSSGSIWTSSIICADSYAEAEFQVMLELQQDWGDSYMPEGFLDDFGRLLDENDKPVDRDDPVFPGEDAWESAGYFNVISGEGEVTSGMLTIDPLEALVQLGKVQCDLTDDVIDAAVAGKVRLHVIAETIDA